MVADLEEIDVERHPGVDQLRLAVRLQVAREECRRLARVEAENERVVVRVAAESQRVEYL